MKLVLKKLLSHLSNAIALQSMIALCLLLFAFNLYGYNINGYIFVGMLMILVRGLFIDLLAKDSGVVSALQLFLKSILPYIVFLLIFGILLQVKTSVYLSVMCVLFLFSLFNSSLLFFLQKVLPGALAQIIVGAMVLFLFTSNYFAIGLIQNYFVFEAQSNIFYLLACINPLMMVANSFGIDVFHANQLYQVFGSVFIVEQLKLLQLVKFYLILSLLFVVMGTLFPRQVEENKVTN